MEALNRSFPFFHFFIRWPFHFTHLIISRVFNLLFSSLFLPFFIHTPITHCFWLSLPRYCSSFLHSVLFFPIVSQWPHDCYLMCCHDSLPKCCCLGHSSTSSLSMLTRVGSGSPSWSNCVVQVWILPVFVCVCVYVCLCVCVCVRDLGDYICSVWIHGLGWAISIHNGKFMSN